VPTRVNRRRYSQLRGRRLSAYEHVVERLAASPPGGWMFVHVFTRIDRRLLPLTRGRTSVAVGTPVGLLETTGARTGRRRQIPLLYTLDGDAVVLVASNAGRQQEPAWLRNLRARDTVRFLTREHGWRSYRARVATGAERTRRWAAMADLYAGYDTYQGRTGGREIAIVVAEPLTPGS
jgi:deazaflavin-dependent oxidoreductase (nitroreductase family)